MKGLKFLMVKIFILISALSFAQNVNRKYISHTNTSDGLEIKVSDGTYYLHFKNDFICENTFVPKNEIFNKNSHAVLLNSKIATTKKETKEYYQLNAKNFSVKINYNPFQIEYLKNGKVFVSEKLGYIKKDSTEIIEFNLDSKEVLYGGGARVVGMNRRGNRLQLYNRAHYGYENKAELMNFCIPLVLSSKIYAIHFDNPAIGYLDLDSKKNNSLQYETISGRKTYQVILGDKWEDLISNYTQLTGKQPLPARWMFGNFASRFGYHSQTETERTIQKFRDEKIPVDAVILDLYWFGKTIQGTMGNLEVFKDSFPDFEKMVTNFNKIGVKTIPITEPFILTTSSKWQETVDKKVLATKLDGTPATWDFYFGNTGLVDVFKPEGKSWFWNIYKDLANKGVAGVWGDLGEPEVFPAFANTVAGKADEVHNIYGHQWAKLVFEGYQNDFPKQRPFILMRAGYSGSQKYGMIPWSGDVNRNWGGLSGQTEIALQMGMQGLGYMHSDLGGFAGNNVDDELYSRWLQYGVFNPVFRPHAQEEAPSEPVFRSQKAKDLARKAIELRYQLLPYNYNLAFENSQKGKPLMRPLFFEEPKNEPLLSKSDTYLWGNDFLISPIINPGQKEKTVYFPKSNNWFDFYTDEKKEAGTFKNILLKEESIPTFVRGGSFIPMTKIVQTTEDYNQNEMDIHFYFDESVKESERKIYFDDGKTSNNFENGLYEILELEAEWCRNTLEIDIETQLGNAYKASEKTFHFIIHNSNRKPKSIQLKGKKIPFEYISTSKKILFDMKYLQDESEIKIKF